MASRTAPDTDNPNPIVAAGASVAHVLASMSSDALAVTDRAVDRGGAGPGRSGCCLSLRNAGEEGRLKRQVAQATKMQAVGQLRRRRRA